MICFIDQDGVLADFNKGAHEAHGRPDAYTSGDPKALGEFNIEKIWGISPEEFWEPIRANPDFWFTLDEMPEAKGIIENAKNTFGLANCCVLTSPDFEDPHCVPGKHYWLQHHFPEFFGPKAKTYTAGQLLFGSDKYFVSGSGRVLIDDRDKNIREFQKHGGVGIRVPRLWNQEWASASHTLDIVKERIIDAHKVPEGSSST
ncbi:MAG: hypothetical protein KGI27_10015 [Thaumarchaeota archaeon]|nr:hypothetical protein [Nitrososphaerota archaeon]